ncbi:MAG: diguanylate cyclase domain protein [Sporomusa sp.]|nr:diguanylate cyclase domain protein [Sporomusa sp.]
MSRDNEHCKVFVARMFILALITGLLISLGTPLTYLSWAWKAKQAETGALAQQIAREAQEVIIYKSDMNQNNLQQLSSLVLLYQQKPDVKYVKIATNWSNSESQAVSPSPALFDIIRRVDITFHGTTHGYVEIIVNAASVVMSTVLLAGIFFGLALLINTLMYRMPLSIINENEKALEIVFDKLKKTSEELAHVQSMVKESELLECKTNLSNANQLIKKLNEEV